MLARHQYLGPGDQPGERRYQSPAGQIITVRCGAAAVYASRDLRWWVEPAGSDLGLQITQVDEDGTTRIYTRVTSAVWAQVQHRYRPDQLAPIRAALVALHGEASVAALSRRAA